LNHRVREILPDGQVVTFAGTGTAGFKDGPADVAQFTGPTGIAVDASGNIYVADTSNERIRKIRSDGSVVTLAGNGTRSFRDGSGCEALFSNPIALALRGKRLVIAETLGNRIRVMQLP